MESTGTSSLMTNIYVTWGVAILLGILSSLVATFLYPKILLALEGRKIISQRLRRRQAEYLNTIIEELHSGKRDRSEYLVRIKVAVGVMLNAGFVFCTGALVILALKQTL